MNDEIYTVCYKYDSWCGTLGVRRVRGVKGGSSPTHLHPYCSSDVKLGTPRVAEQKGPEVIISLECFHSRFNFGFLHVGCILFQDLTQPWFFLAFSHNLSLLLCRSAIFIFEHITTLFTLKTPATWCTFLLCLFNFVADLGLKAQYAHDCCLMCSPKEFTSKDTTAERKDNLSRYYFIRGV